MTEKATYQLKVFETVNLLNQATAELIITIAKKSIAERGRFLISLSGGETPKKLYALLAEPSFSSRIEWENVFVFWGDERCVPLDDERNNAFQAKSILLNKVRIPPSNIHIVPVNFSPAEAASNYEQTISDFFGHLPWKFDLILLGLGKNGHTASLFPGNAIINHQPEGIKKVYVPEEKMFRITMTAALINHARHILFLVAGKEKAAIIDKILSGNHQSLNYPARLIKQPEGELYWFLDGAAASSIRH